MGIATIRTLLVSLLFLIGLHGFSAKIDQSRKACASDFSFGASLEKTKPQNAFIQSAGAVGFKFFHSIISIPILEEIEESFDEINQESGNCPCHLSAFYFYHLKFPIENKALFSGHFQSSILRKLPLNLLFSLLLI